MYPFLVCVKYLITCNINRDHKFDLRLAVYIVKRILTMNLMLVPPVAEWVSADYVLTKALNISASDGLVPGYNYRSCLAFLFSLSRLLRPFTDLFNCFPVAGRNKQIFKTTILWTPAAGFGIMSTMWVLGSCQANFHPVNGASRGRQSVP